MAHKATAAVFIDSYHPQKDGTCRISIRVTYQRKKRYYPTKFSLTPEDFRKVMNAERPREEIKSIRRKLMKLEKDAADIIDKLTYFTWDAFEKQFLQNQGYADRLNSAFDTYVAQLREEGRIGSAISYEYAKHSLNRFSANAVFADVNPEFLRKYERWMLQSGNQITNKKGTIIKGSSVTTVGIYLRCLRTIFNNAISEELITKDLYPFGKRKYEIPAANNTKRHLAFLRLP
ncbi:MAG: phage integrase SAM-like domain-containing protein [Flavisolibacter sp.]|nr:phage integrase SAM-like domain-containing protein [Flavisolibacter sp.]MBD0331683.1 phage integrase SAM-like domain-containing protein [Chitinophagaceae bacterium]